MSKTIDGVGGSREVGGCCHGSNNLVHGGGDRVTSLSELDWGRCGGGACGSSGMFWNGRVDPGLDQ